MKKVLAIILAAMCMIPVAAGAKTLEVTISSDSMYVMDGAVSKTTLDAPAYIENGRTMVPIRVISENFGASVEWDPVLRQVTIKKDTTMVVLTIDSDKALINGAETVLDAAPVILNGRTMVPLRFVSEALGSAVEYVPSTAQILISDEEAVAVINGVEIRKYDYDFLKGYMFDSEVPDEQLVMAVPYMNAFCEEMTLMATKAKENGIVLDEFEKADIRAAVEPDMENIYTGTLAAAIVKGLENYTYAVKYISNLQFDVDEAEIEKMYKDNYVCAKHVLISTLDENGQPLSDKDKKLAKEKAEYALQKYNRDRDFDALIKEFGEDPGMENYPDGYVFTRGEMVEEFENAAFDMKVDEVSAIVETVYGYHIIKRLALPKMSDQTKLAFLQQLNEEEYGKMLDSLIAGADIKYNYTNNQIANMIK